MTAENSGETAPGRPFKAGESGNPGGRPKGLARYTRELVGDDGRKLADFWLQLMNDPGLDVKSRLDASRLLAERAFGKPTQTVEHAGSDKPLTVEVKHSVDHLASVASILAGAGALTSP